MQMRAGQLSSMGGWSGGSSHAAISSQNSILGVFGNCQYIGAQVGSMPSQGEGVTEIQFPIDRFELFLSPRLPFSIVAQ